MERNQHSRRASADPLRRQCRRVHRRCRIGARRAERGNQPEQRSSDERRERGQRQHASPCADAGESGGIAGDQGDHELRRPRGDNETGRATSGGEDQILGAHLPQQTTAPRADRPLHENLMPQTGRTRQKKGRQICARDEQDQRACGHGGKHRLGIAIAKTRRTRTAIADLQIEPTRLRVRKLQGITKVEACAARLEDWLALVRALRRVSCVQAS